MKYLVILPFLLAIICGVISHSADAAPLIQRPAHYNYTDTVSHCGYVRADQKNYARHPRNVEIIQRKLTQMGYHVGYTGVDGVYGSRTRAAMRAFQKDYDLPASGKATGDTVEKLAYYSHPNANVRRCHYEAHLNLVR